MNKIRELRKKQNMTQKELAKQLQIADSTLSYWEMGKYEPDKEALIKLSRFFEVPIDYILGGDFTKWNFDTDSSMFVAEDKALYNNIKNVPVAFERAEFDDLTQEEIDTLAEYAAFMKSKRGK